MHLNTSRIDLPHYAINLCYLAHIEFTDCQLLAQLSRCALDSVEPVAKVDQCSGRQGQQRELGNGPKPVREVLEIEKVLERAKLLKA